MDWMDLASVPWIGVFLATLSAFAVGGIWYMPQLFGNQWLGHVGLTPESVAAGQPGIAGWVKVATMAAMTAIGLAVVFVGLGVDTAVGGLFTGAALAVFFRMTTHFIHNGFSQRSDELSLIDGLHDVVAMSAAGVILGGFL